MNIHINKNEMDGMQFGNANARTRQEEKEHNKKGSSVFAGDMNVSHDSVLSKRIQAQKNAIKTVLDTFSNDQQNDNCFIERQQKVSDLDLEANNALEEMKKIKSLKQELKETYSISDDSQEQKDLELLEKQKRIITFHSGESLTKEESQHLKEMPSQTEYQKAALEYASISGEWQTQKNAANKQKKSENATIESMKVELVKTHPMVDAENTADAILDQASKEIVGLLVNEAKDHVDEELKQAEDEAEKIAKEKAEEKVKEAEKREKDAKQEGISEETKLDTNQLNQITKADGYQEKLQMEINIMINNQKLLDEDLKGIVVDEQL